MCCINSLSVSFFTITADFGDFNRYDSQEFLQKFVLFPIVSSLCCTFNTRHISDLFRSSSFIPTSYQSCLCRTGFRMSECWKKPLRKWLCFISPSGEQVFKSISLSVPCLHQQTVSHITIYIFCVVLRERNLLKPLFV